jgi:prepilin-type N-terminal cleavage/methylation domain-containing protein
MAGHKKGFTLIEILVCMVVIGVLAAVAVPQYSAGKKKAFAAVMVADLRSAAMYEEQYAADNHGQYFSGTAKPDAPLNGFTPSPSVTVTMTAFNIMGSQLADWTAIARHPQSSESCEMRAGTITCTTSNPLTTGTLPN